MNRHRLGLLMVLAAASLVLVAAPAAPAYEYTYARVVRLSLVDGEVQVARPPSDAQTDYGWEQAVVNLPIQQGYNIATGHGRAEIEFENGATARLAENSLLQFTELALSNGGRITRLTLTQGTATFYANLSRDDSFVVITPHLQAVIPENARFRVDVSDAGTQVSALKGEVEVDSRAGASHLTKGYSLDYRTTDPDRVSTERTSRSDEWDRWVANRDEVIQTSSTAALQYVRSPYTYGLSDLYNHGSWYSFGGYGLCWRPYGAGFDWYPFGVGRWALLPGLGWTWISYEPWGWLPYHFGRWVYSPTLGWLWVPGHRFHHWHPALVTWVRIGNRTGWVPLHPHDRPGRTPANLQHGIISTGSKGFTDTDRFERKQIARGEHWEVLRDLPKDFANARQTSKTKYIGPPVRVLAGGKGDQPTIVFDPKDRKFVNNPNEGGSKGSGGAQSVGDANIEPGRRSPADAKPPKHTLQPAVPHAPTGGSGGAAPSGDRKVRPEKVSPPPPPPPRVQPPAHREQSSPPPKTERPPARLESPRPAPAPRSSFTSHPSSPPASHSSGSSAPARSGRY